MTDNRQVAFKKNFFPSFFQLIDDDDHRFLLRALTFEQCRVGFMQAVNVQDAACYICWAFARAYEVRFCYAEASVV